MTLIFCNLYDSIFVGWTGKLWYSKEAGDGFAAQDFLYLTFPDDDDIPALLLQSCVVAGISLHVGGEFLFPELAVGGWGTRIFAPLMPVPETAIYENDRFVPGQHNIRTPRQVFPLDAEPIAKAVQQFPEQNFRLSVPPLDGGHIPLSLLRREAVHNYSSK